METHKDPLPRSAEPRRHTPLEFTEAVRQRAQEIYELQGRVPGHDLENWLQAEADVRARDMAQHGRVAAHRTIRHITVKIDHVIYTGAYDPAASGGYTLGELTAGVPIEVRFEGDSMLLKRRNGAELRTRLVRKEQAEAHHA